MYNFMKKLLSVLLLLALMPQAALAEYYGIKVGGVSVTSDNCDNITGENIKRCFGENSDYWVRYEPSTKTLTLHNISIERSGSGNRAILNESCDGLTIVFDEKFVLSSRDASPIRLNANTTITYTGGLYGKYDEYSQRIWSWHSDAITISNGAQLVISNIRMHVSSSDAACFYGNTGNEKVIFVDAFVLARNFEGYGIKDIGKIGLQNSSLLLETSRGTGATNLKELTLVGKERMTLYDHDYNGVSNYGIASTTPVYFSETEKTFLSSEDDSKASNIAILSYIPIDEETFPDENFRNYVSERFDNDSNGELNQLESLKAKSMMTYNKGISSLKGIEHLRFLETIDCRHNNLTYLDLRDHLCLTSVECNSNQITTLRLSEHPQLTKIDCNNNLITNIDFSGCPKIKDIDISRNRINGWMTDVLESLPDATGSSDAHDIKIGDNGTNDNVCTQEQADIAKNKGWNVNIGGIDSEGNIVYYVKIGGTKITSANANDLTVLPGVTKNCADGYARYDEAKQTLYLSGVDIVNDNEDGVGIYFYRDDANPTIEIGQDPVNVTGKSFGLIYSNRHHDYAGTLTITSKEDYWYSEKLTIVGEEERAIWVQDNCVINGVVRLEAKTLYGPTVCDIDWDLTIAGDAELRLKARASTNPLAASNLILQDDNSIVAPAGVSLSPTKHWLCDEWGLGILNKEVVIGKLREYNYYVADTRISNANQHAVLGDTTVVFHEPAYNGGPGTLVLTNANIEAGSASGISASKTLYLKLLGDNTINSTTRGLEFSKPAFIQGPGSLYAKGQYGIDAHMSKLFISDEAQVTAEGTTRYAIDGQETTISGENTVVRMKCEPEARGTFRASTSLTLNDGLKIESPEGAQYVDGEIKDADGNVIKDEWVTIQYTEDYGIKVAGIKVTNHNMADVLGDGTVSYDPETLTLTLTDASIDGGDGSGIEAEQELHIKLEGSNTITCTRSLNGTSHGIWFKDKGFIEGPGSLSITAMYGIFAIGNNQPKALQILDGAQVSAEGDLNGIIAGITTISGEETVVNAKGDDGSFGCTALNLNDELEITQPAGASFNLTKLAICVGRLGDIVTSWVTIQKVNKYNIYVAGTQVTSLNQADVLGDGTVSYDAETNTLTLNNANIETEAETEFAISAIEINIRLEGENKITSKGSGIMGQTLNIEATTDDSHGPGTLDIIASYTGIRATNSLKVCGGAHVTAESTGSYAILTQLLTVSGAETVLGMKGEEGTYSGFAPELEDGLELTQPVGAYYNEETGHIVNAEGEPIKGEWVVIGAPVSVESYEILIAGIQVTELNKDDILGDGTVSYDAETNTLTLNGANIEAEGEGLSTQIDEVIIKLEGENSIEVPEGFGIYSDASFTITGPGSLSVTSKFEALIGSFVIEGGAKVTADSQTRSALWSFYPLAVSGSETVVMLKGAKGAVEIYGADSEEAVLSLSDGLVLGLPEGAHCGIVDVLVEEEEDMWIPNGYILDANDNNITDQWVIIGSEDYITGIDDLKDSKDLKDSTYNLAGQRAPEGYKGIVIEGGQKVLKK